MALINNALFQHLEKGLTLEIVLLVYQGEYVLEKPKTAVIMLGFHLEQCTLVINTCTSTCRCTCTCEYKHVHGLLIYMCTSSYRVYCRPSGALKSWHASNIIGRRPGKGYVRVGSYQKRLSCDRQTRYLWVATGGPQNTVEYFNY